METNDYFVFFVHLIDWSIVLSCLLALFISAIANILFGAIVRIFFPKAWKNRIKDSD